MADLLRELAPGVTSWRAPHPEWNPHRELVASHALSFERGMLVLDPLLGPEPELVLDALRTRLGSGCLHVYVTIPYHVRDAFRIANEFGGTILGHPNLARRLDDPGLARDATRPDELPFGLRALRIGDPVRSELPLHSPTHRALVIGDVAVGIRGGLRIWERSAGREAWYRDRFLPSLAHLGELDVDHVLVGHGSPVIGDGHAALREMLATQPVERMSAELAGEAVPPA